MPFRPWHRPLGCRARKLEGLNLPMVCCWFEPPAAGSGGKKRRGGNVFFPHGQTISLRKKEGRVAGARGCGLPLLTAWTHNSDSSKKKRKKKKGEPLRGPRKQKGRPGEQFPPTKKNSRFPLPSHYNTCLGEDRERELHSTSPFCFGGQRKRKGEKRTLPLCFGDRLRTRRGKKKKEGEGGRRRVTLQSIFIMFHTQRKKRGEKRDGPALVSAVNRRGGKQKRGKRALLRSFPAFVFEKRGKEKKRTACLFRGRPERKRGPKER